MVPQRVLLINPLYIYRESRIQTLSPNLGLLYLAAALERENEVKILDLNLTCDLNEKISGFKPDIVGITAYSPQFPSVVNLARDIKKRFPDQMIILGGPHATIDGANILKRHDCFDYALRGEGEFSFPRMLAGGPFTKINGLVFREDGEIINNGVAVVDPLDSLPFPARHLIDHERYQDFPFHYLHHHHTSLMTSRGCPYNCLYCYNTPVKHYRQHSPEYVIREIEQVMQTGITDFIITDDVFTLDPSRTAEICNLIVDKGLDVTWSCETRPDMVTPELLKLMKRAGCHFVYYGIESGNRQVLDRLGKGFSLEAARDAVRITKEAGIRVHGGFILGLPFESESQMGDTVEFSRRVGLDGAEFTIATPYPGTGLWNLAGYNDASNLRVLENLNYTSTSGNPFRDRNKLAGAYSQAIIGFYFRRKVFLDVLHHVLTKGTLQRRWQLFKYLTFKGPADNTPGPDHDSLPTTPTLIEKFFKEQCQLCHGCDHTCKKRWLCYIQKIVNGQIYSAYSKGLKLIEWGEFLKEKNKKKDLDIPRHGE